MKHSKNDNQLELDFERLCILFENLKFAHLSTFLFVCFFYFLISMNSSREIAVLWTGIFIIIYIPRFLLSVIFSRKLRNGEITKLNINPWEYYVLLTVIGPYICIISVIFLPYGDNELISFTLAAMILMTLVTGSVLALATSRLTVLLYFNMAYLSIIVKCFLVQVPLFTLLGFLLCFGYFLATGLILKQHKTLVENISLKIENRKFSLIDPLTKLWNRRRLELHTEKLVPSAKRTGDPFTVIILDIDHFKEYNDTKGHSAGDDLLIKVANVLHDCSREQDLVVRYGGEEFLVVLPETGINDAASIAERIRITVKEKTDVTISAGLAEFNQEMDFEQLVKKADEALYTAKESGRDRYILAPV